jgi:hypothetical protein
MQFRLRTLLIAIAISCMVMCVFGHVVRVVERIASVGGL